MYHLLHSTHMNPLDWVLSFAVFSCFEKTKWQKENSNVLLNPQRVWWWAWTLLMEGLEFCVRICWPTFLSECTYANGFDFSPLWFNETKVGGGGGESEWLTDHKSCKWNWDLDNLDQWSNRWHNQCCWHQICTQKRRRKPTWYTTYKTRQVLLAHELPTFAAPVFCL